MCLLYTQPIWMWQEGVRLSASERPTEMDGRINVRRMTAAVSFTWWSVIKYFSHAQIINAQNHKQAHTHTHKATLMSANRRKQESTHRRCFIYVDVMPVDMHPARNTAFLTSHTHTQAHTKHTNPPKSPQFILRLHLWDHMQRPWSKLLHWRSTKETRCAERACDWTFGVCII